MPGLTETIKILIETSTSKAAGDIKKLGTEIKSADGATAKFKTGFKGTGDLLRNNALLGTAAVTTAGLAIAKFGKTSIDAFQNTALAAGKLAESTGLSAEEASRWNEVAQDVGVETAALETGFRKLAQNIGANPAKFAELGVAVRDAETGQIDMNASIIQAIDLLNRTPDAAEKARLGVQLFGKNWSSLSEIIASGADELVGKLKEVSEAKITNDKEIANARRFRDTMDNLSDVTENLQITLGQLAVEGFGPTLEVAVDLADKLNDVTDAVGGLGSGVDRVIRVFPGIGQILGTFEDAGKALDSNASALDRVKAGATALLPPLRALPFLDVKDDAEKAAESLEKLAEKAAEMGPQGFDVAGRAAAGFVDSMSAQDIQAQQSEAAMDALKDAQKAEADSAKEAADAAKAHADALKEAADEALRLVGGARDLADVNLELVEQNAENVASIEEANKAQGKNNDLNLKAIKSARDLADGFAAQAEAQAASTGKTLTATDKQNAFNTSMLRSAAAAKGPLRDSILAYIGTVNNIPPSKLTAINAAIARGDIAAAEAILNETSRTRDAAIVADAKTAQAERDLNFTARDRFLNIIATYRLRGALPGIPGAGAALGGIQRFANGGVVTVGEKGPEQVFLPEGSHVISTDQARMWIKEATAATVGRPSITVNGGQHRSRRAEEAHVIAQIRGYYRRNGSIVKGRQL